jgi:hypothetical protein
MNEIFLKSPNVKFKPRLFIVQLKENLSINLNKTLMLNSTSEGILMCS